jgi:hypothetical protein
MNVTSMWRTTGAGGFREESAPVDPRHQGLTDLDGDRANHG